MQGNSALAFAAVVTLIGVLPLERADAQLNAATATKIIEGCAAHARARSQSHATAVYDDDGGHPIATLRMDGNAPAIMAFAMQKAGAIDVSGKAPADDVACAEAGVRAAGLAVARCPG